MEEMLIKDFPYLDLWQPFYSAERNHLCNFGRGCYEIQFCEIILNLGQWFKRFLIGRGYYEEQFFEIILDFDQLLWRKC